MHSLILLMLLTAFGIFVKAQTQYFNTRNAYTADNADNGKFWNNNNNNNNNNDFINPSNIPNDSSDEIISLNYLRSSSKVNNEDNNYVETSKSTLTNQNFENLQSTSNLNFDNNDPVENSQNSNWQLNNNQRVQFEKPVETNFDAQQVDDYKNLNYQQNEGKFQNSETIQDKISKTSPKTSNYFEEDSRPNERPPNYKTVTPSTFTTTRRKSTITKSNSRTYDSSRSNEQKYESDLTNYRQVTPSSTFTTTRRRSNTAKFNTRNDEIESSSNERKYESDSKLNERKYENDFGTNQHTTNYRQVTRSFTSTTTRRRSNTNKFNARNDESEFRSNERKYESDSKLNERKYENDFGTNQHTKNYRQVTPSFTSTTTRRRSNTDKFNARNEESDFESNQRTTNYRKVTSRTLTTTRRRSSTDKYNSRNDQSDNEHMFTFGNFNNFPLSTTPRTFLENNMSEWSSQTNYNNDRTSTRKSHISFPRKRISQEKYEAYMKKIYGDDDEDSSGISTRIDSDKFNGRDVAEPGQYPHMAAIGFQTTTNSIDWQCGGSLIDEYFVITAAHCTDLNGQKPFYVKLGDINLKIKEDTVDPQRLRIKDIYKYPNYTKSSYYNDIALIRLSNPVVFTEFIHPIRLWEHTNIPYRKLFAMGYGATKFGKAKTNILTHLNLTLVPNHECDVSIPKNSETKDGIIDSQICAIDRIANRDTCQGDSGGPLQLNMEGVKRIEYSLIGITSYGVRCGGPVPSVYTRVSSFLDWIEGVVWPEVR